MTGKIAILEFDRVDKCFVSAHYKVEVLHKLNIHIDEGEFVALTGPSGSGKSTFLHLAALLDKPTAGTLNFDGKEVSTLPELALCQLRKEAIGIVFQNYYLLQNRTVYDNVLFRFRYLNEDKDTARQCVQEALSRMGLTDIAHRPARLLSGGEMQRVAIARAIAHTPRLLVADEPTGNLDGTATKAVMAHFQELNQSGITILLVTHNVELLDYCTRQLICRDGHINTPASL